MSWQELYQVRATQAILVSKMHSNVLLILVSLEKASKPLH